MHINKKEAGAQLAILALLAAHQDTTVVGLELRNQEFLKLESLKNRSQDRVVELLQPW